MSKFIDNTGLKGLTDLLSQIHQGKIVLPNFQRNFVWEPNATGALITSVAHSYPAGSLLLIRNSTDNEMFASREFEGAPKMTEKPVFLALDGQQRLTSLYQALYSVGNHRYFLNIHKLVDEGCGDFESALIIKRENSREVKKWECKDAQAEELIMPLNVLQKGAGGLLQWAIDIAHLEGENRRKITNRAEIWTKAITDYQFPVVTLEHNTPPDAVCTIFETLNRRGVKLTVFELLTARFWPRDIDLRKMWSQVQDDYPIIKEFAVDPYYLLQIISLAFRDTPSCKRSDVLEMDMGEDFNARWEKVVVSLAAALQFLKEKCGVTDKKWLPYSTMLIPLASVLVKNSITSADAAQKREKLARWFWCSVFGQRYESSPNTQAVDDFKALNAWLGESPEMVPASVSKAEFNPDVLREVTRRQSAVYCGVMCLIMSGNAQDFYTDRAVDEVLKSSHPDDKVDDHHIFPDGYLKTIEEWKKNPSARNCVLNRTLITAGTNKKIGKQEPSLYMQAIQNERSKKPESFFRMLASHFIADIDSWKPTNDFKRFLDARQKALHAAIKAKMAGSDQ